MPQLDEDPKGKMVHAGESRPRTEIPSKRDDEKPHRRGASTGDKFDGTIDGTEMKAGIANKSTEKEADSKSQAGIKVCYFSLIRSTTNVQLSLVDEPGGNWSEGHSQA